MSPRILIYALVLAGSVGFASMQTAAAPVSTNAPGGDFQSPKNLPPKLREKLANMPPTERQKFLERWQQLRKLSPEARKLLNKNYQNFSKMPPEQREQLKQRLKEWQNMSAEEKTRLQENFHRWKQFSPQEREELRKHHARPSPKGSSAPFRAPTAPVANAVPASAEGP